MMMETHIDEGLETEGEAGRAQSGLLTLPVHTLWAEEAHTVGSDQSAGRGACSGMISSKHQAESLQHLCRLLQETVMIPASSCNGVCLLFLCGQHFSRS